MGKYSFNYATNCDEHNACHIAENMFKKKRKFSLPFYIYYTQYWYSVGNIVHIKLGISLRRELSRKVIKQLSLKFSFTITAKEFFNKNHLYNLK